MNIHDFKTIYRSYSPCPDGVEAFESCSTRKEVFDVIMHHKYYDFIFRSILRGWGPTPDDIKDVFGGYINGRYECQYVDGDVEYLSCMWCKRSGAHSIPENVRVLFVVGCNVTINIEPWSTVKIVVDKNSNVVLKCGNDSISFVENYGGSVSYWGYCNVKIKNIR